MTNQIKYILFISASILVWLTSHAEVSNKVTIGLNIDSTVIMADSMSFGHLIYHIETGPDQKHMLLKLREAAKNGPSFCCRLQ